MQLPESGPVRFTLQEGELNGQVLRIPPGLDGVVMAFETIRDFALYPNRPNPFNPQTAIHFEVPAPAEIRLEVYNAMGQKIRTLVAGYHLPGAYGVSWDGRDEQGRMVGSGIYLARMVAPGFDRVQKMLMLK